MRRRFHLLGGEKKEEIHETKGGSWRPQDEAGNGLGGTCACKRQKSHMGRVVAKVFTPTRGRCRECCRDRK